WAYSTSPGNSGNVFQLSFMENKTGKKLEPPPLLQEIATALARKLGGTISGAESGPCAYGQFGTATVKTARFPYFQIWSISNGVHFVTATFTCDVEPTSEELRQVKVAVASLHLVADAKSKWKFW